MNILGETLESLANATNANTDSINTVSNTIFKIIVALEDRVKGLEKEIAKLKAEQDKKSEDERQQLYHGTPIT